MNSLLSTPLVPEKEVYPVCTNGLQTGTMVVTSQNKMCNAKRHYIATYLDKPTDFKCVYAGILVAFVIGVIVGILAMSIASFGTGAVIAGILVATLVGIIASYGLGGAVCRYCLERAVWDKFHPNIIIDGKFAIVGSSKLICTPPLPLLTTPGAIQIFYDKDVANKTAEIYATQNVLRIFSASLSGYAIPGIAKWLFGKSAALTKLAQFAGGFGLMRIVRNSEDMISDWISGDTVGKDDYKWINDFHNSKGTGESQFKEEFWWDVAEQINTSAGNADAINTKIVSSGNVMKYAWKNIKADPSYHSGMSKARLNALKSKHLKGAWADKKDATKNNKTNLYLTGLDFFGSIIGQSIYKSMAKNLEKWGRDAESTAIANIGIYEKQI